MLIAHGYALRRRDMCHCRLGNGSTMPILMFLHVLVMWHGWDDQLRPSVSAMHVPFPLKTATSHRQHLLPLTLWLEISKCWCVAAHSATLAEQPSWLDTSATRFLKFTNPTTPAIPMLFARASSSTTTISLIQLLKTGGAWVFASVMPQMSLSVIMRYTTHLILLSAWDGDGHRRKTACTTITSQAIISTASAIK